MLGALVCGDEAEILYQQLGDSPLAAVPRQNTFRGLGSLDSTTHTPSIAVLQGLAIREKQRAQTTPLILSGHTFLVCSPLFPTPTPSIKHYCILQPHLTVLILQHLGWIWCHNHAIYFLKRSTQCPVFRGPASRTYVSVLFYSCNARSAGVHP